MCAKVHNCVLFLVFGAGMNVGIEWWMYVIGLIVESSSILKWKQTAILRVLTLIGMYTFFNSTEYIDVGWYEETILNQEPVKHVGKIVIESMRAATLAKGGWVLQI